MHFGSKVHSANEWNDDDFCGKMKTTAVAQGVAGAGAKLGHRRRLQGPVAQLVILTLSVGSVEENRLCN